MKQFLLHVLLFSSVVTSTRAQYFQELYGSGNNNILTDGHNVSSGITKGYMLVAPGSAHQYSFSVTRADWAGYSLVGSPTFNNEYNLSDASGMPAPGLIVQDVRSIEIPGNQYALAGSYRGGMSGAGQGVFFQIVDEDGTLPGPAIGYYVSRGSYTDIHVQKITASLQSTDLYICGYVTEPSGDNRIFVMKVSATGALLWAYIYPLNWNGGSSDTPYDIIESYAFNNMANTYELLVVGKSVSGSAAGGIPETDAFVLRIDYATGAVSNPTDFYGAPLQDDIFTCIKPSVSPKVDPAQAGYVIGGNTNTGTTNNDFWFVAINQNGIITWTNLFHYNAEGPVRNDYCNDIIEHWNATYSEYEYYLGGYTDAGPFGGEDVLVIKTDDDGNAVPSGQFTYGEAGDQRCIQLDWTDGGDEGISVFGYADHPMAIGGKDLYLVKAAYDGSTACDYNILTPDQDHGPQLLGAAVVNHAASFSTYPLYSEFNAELEEKQICWDCNSLPQPNLVAHWNFTSGSLVDVVNGLTGTINGGVTATAGQLGTPNTAYLFDGSTGYIQVPSDPVLDLTSWTITALVRPDGFYSGTCQGNAVVWRGSQYSTNHYNLEFFDNGADMDCFVYTPTDEVFAGNAAGTSPLPESVWYGTNACVSNPCISTGTWYCVWLSYDGVNEILELWVDGVKKRTIPWTNQYTTWGTVDLFFGRSDNTSFPYFMNGAIDDIAIYDGPIVCPLSCDDAANGLAKPADVQNVPATSTMTVVPNPVSDIVTITTPANWAKGVISVHNMMGQAVRRIDIDGAKSTSVNMRDLPAGLYIIKATNGTESLMSKVTKN